MLVISSIVSGVLRKDAELVGPEIVEEVALELEITLDSEVVMK